MTRIAVVVEDHVPVQIFKRHLMHSEKSSCLSQRLDQRIYVAGLGVEIERGAGGGGNPEDPHERLGAVVSSPDSHAVLIQDRGHVMGMDVSHRETDHSAPPVRVARSE